MKDTKQEILHFWFEEIAPQQWFHVDELFDRQVFELFQVIYGMAKDTLCDHWKQDAEGCVALCLLLDQFPRCMFRGKPESYDTDAKALLTAKYAVSKGYDQLLAPIQRHFIYKCYEHSENQNDQKKCVALFEQIKSDDPLGYEHALRQKDIIEKFGRFPRRNIILGRSNTPEEEAFLIQKQ